MSVIVVSTSNNRSLQLANSPAAPTVPDLLFCIPDNPKMTELWDRVEDRLFKIRHCMNIDGKVRQLALFSPPIDPALLVQAAAAGLSIADALSDMAAPMPHYRFSYMLQKANEFTNEVKSLGSQLLGLLEKKDGEELSLFRQVHEQNILKAARAIKQMAIDDGKQNLATLESSKIGIQIRLDDYRARQFINLKEFEAMAQTWKADDKMINEQAARLVAGYLALIPDVTAGISGATASPVLTVSFGGSLLSDAANLVASHIGIQAAKHRNNATGASTWATYFRRQEDWNLQIKTAAEELVQVDRQILGAQIKINTAEKELENHDLQIEQSQEMYEWLKNKYTNGQLYTWMANQVKTVYKEMFNLAYSMAKRAQVCMDYELGASGTSIIQYGQWDSSKSGLLAGERLAVQLKRLENKYIESNARELEMSKNISLALLNPSALQDLIVTGSCTFELPEFLFDLDHPGQYFRRIKSVSISIPCIAGPNVNINAILNLTKAGRRDNPITNIQNYAPTPAYGVPIESIATSSAQNDSGVFELNFKDERYLPFEGKGAVSEWTLELSQIERDSAEVIRLFDFKTISDVIVHIKYTSRYDGGLAGVVKEYIDTELGTIAPALNSNNGLQYVFSLRHDMPNEWNEFKANGNVNFKIEKSRLPYLIQAMSPEIVNFTVIVPLNTDFISGSPAIKLTGTGVNNPSTNNVDLTAHYTDAVTAIEPRIGGVSSSSTPMGSQLTLNEGNLTQADLDCIDDIIIIAKIQVQ